mgnify:CR=1 FL=1
MYGTFAITYYNLVQIELISLTRKVVLNNAAFFLVKFFGPKFRL